MCSGVREASPDVLHVVRDALLLSAASAASGFKSGKLSLSLSLAISLQTR